MNAALLLVAMLACILPVLVRFCRRVWRIHCLTAEIPGPPTYPLIGNLLEFLGPRKIRYDNIVHLGKTWGTLFKIWMGPFLGVVVMDPDDVQVVLNSPHLSEKADFFYGGLRPVLGDGLLSRNGADYKRHRKAITASMQIDLLQEFVTIFNSNGRELVRRLEPLASTGEVFDVTPLIGWCSSHSLCQTVLSTEAPGLEVEEAAFVQTVQVASKVLLFRCLRPWYGSDLLFKLSHKEYKRYQSAKAGIAGFADKILKRKTDQMAAFKVAQVNAPKFQRKTFLEHFLTSSEASVLSRSELSEELKTLLLTGSGSSMDFQSMFLLCMSLYPEVQKKIQKELDDVFGDDRDRDVLRTDLPHMPYMECALKEALRYLPPAPVFGRQATKDVQLTSGHVIPEGTMVAVLPIMVHRNPKHWSNPMEFDPDRFASENNRTRHPYSFIPFSAGSRSCIGQRYAMMFAKTVMASVLRRFDVLPNPDGPRRLQDVPLLVGISLSVRGGARIRLRSRKGRHANPA